MLKTVFMNILRERMAKVFCLLLCLSSFSYVNCQLGQLTNTVHSITDVLRERRDVDHKVPSCPTVNNMPARCVDLVSQCPRLYQVVNAHKNNPKFTKTLKQLQCGLNDDKSPLVCCPVRLIPKTPSDVTKLPVVKPPVPKPPVVTKPPKATLSVTKPPATKPPVVTKPSVTKPQATKKPVVAKPPKVKLSVTKPPATKPPVGKPQATKPPMKKPSVTKPPVTKPPVVTKPPRTKLSVTKPPVTKSPVVTKPPVMKPPVTILPVVTKPPVTKPQATKPPVVTKPPVTIPSVTKPPLPENPCKSINAGYLPGRCVSLLECPSLYKKASEGSQDPAVRNEMFRIHCGWVDNVLQICCPLESIATPAPAQPSNQTLQGDSASKASEDLVDALPNPPNCGPYNLNQGKRRVLGGRPAILKMFPWMALLGYRRPRRGVGVEWWCGGSLISTRHVLTAAHCIHGNENSLFQVRLGELDLESDDDGATPIDIPIKKQVIHEDFVPETNDNDIGMLTLETSVENRDYIQPICMPMRQDLRSKRFENQRPFLAGWGQMKLGGKSSTRLQYIQVPVTKTAECNDIYKKDDVNFKALDNRSLCAGYKEGRKDACPGDSGGPLMQPDRNPKTKKTNFYQIGIISYGTGCGSPGYPGIYVRVTEYIPWIIKQATGKIVT